MSNADLQRRLITIMMRTLHSGSASHLIVQPSVGNYLLNISLRLTLSISIKHHDLCHRQEAQEHEGRFKMVVFFRQICRDFSKLDPDFAMFLP